LRKLTVDDISFLISSFSKDELEKPYVKFKYKPVTLKRFILDTQYHQLGFKDKSIQDIKSTLNKYNRNYIYNELLAREGYKRGYSSDAEVQKFVNQWKDHFLASYYMHSYNDSAAISEQEVYDYFLQHNNDDLLSPKVKIAEIHTENLATMELILRDLTTNNFSDKAKIYGSQNGRDGKNYERLNELGDLFSVLNQMEKNEIYGPFERENGYSIIKLVDRQEDTEKISESFEKVKDKIETKLFYEKLETLLNNKTVELADKYQLKINTELARNLSLSEINMFVLRYMGFGGKISAVPLTKQFVRWSDLLKEKRVGILP